jgi:cyanate permease
MRQGPLAGRYPAVAAMVTLALIPYLALSAVLDPLVPIISEQLHMSAQAMSLGSGLGNGAYAVGTVLAVQFAQHLPQRRMLLVYAVLLEGRRSAGRPSKLTNEHTGVSGGR